MYKKRGRPKNKRDLIRFSFHIPKEQYELLTEFSEEEDMSMAQIVRRAVDMYITTQSNMFNLDDNNITIAQHLKETRSKRAQLVNYISAVQEETDVDPSDNLKFEEEAELIFRELNPDGFD